MCSGAPRSVSPGRSSISAPRQLGLDVIMFIRQARLVKHMAGDLVAVTRPVERQKTMIGYLAVDSRNKAMCGLAFSVKTYL